MYTKIFETYILRFSWLLIASLSLYLSLTTFVYFSFRTDIEFWLAKQDFVDNLPWKIAFYTHISSSLVILAVAPFQFIAYFRKKYPTTHRFLGKIYVFGILALATPSGLYMALFANGGFWAATGFFILSLLWFFTTYKAYQTARQKNFKAHQLWMVRSFALTFSAVTLRLWIPILTLGFWVNHDTAVIVTAWLNWIPNVLVAEILMYFFSKKI